MTGQMIERSETGERRVRSFLGK